ncbi:molecular chaperone IbpA [Lutimaribacter pacificus]|uniref:Molecular chaperone IbpA n=1 Tax=Lutimaribacter pacificus TaxID=391948 RepID=A0A1H0NJK9_9RHOB|nr:Hsp20 family protein [Lutimaribacter pacificus]SDO92839.1 molecular chaperone IbpA [Lutimaribacter pacificus]SHK88742.1 molecular chaperone IbpA [Lutimaribacter pacificus]
MATTLDFAPLFRSSVGFDRMLDALETARRVETLDNWPPYDIVKTGEDDYRIDMAVAGFAEDDLTLTQDKNMLIVSGGKETPEGDGGDSYLYRGIAGRSFERRFELADHVRVEGATLSNGLLTVQLKREVPEELKPRRIEIASPEATEGLETRQLETAPEPEPVAA